MTDKSKDKGWYPGHGGAPVTGNQALVLISESALPRLEEELRPPRRIVCSVCSVCNVEFFDGARQVEEFLYIT
jgi:hypothetical protein